MIAVNLLLVFVCWHWATIAFENGAEWTGWFNIFCSALNAVVVLLKVV